MSLKPIDANVTRLIPGDLVFMSMYVTGKIAPGTPGLFVRYVRDCEIVILIVMIRMREWALFAGEVVHAE